MSAAEELNAAERRHGGTPGPRQEPDLTAMKLRAEVVAATLRKPTLDLDDVALIFGLRATATRRVIERPTFPRGFRIGRSDVWRTRDILAWLDRQAEQAAAERPD